jgi:UDP-N-acetylmuramoylalanine--D-glutamate ligase
VINSKFFASGKNILIIGYGKSGKSAYNFLKNNGHHVVVLDDFKTEIPDKMVGDDISNIDVIVKSPSINIIPENCHPMIRNGALEGVPVISTFDLFILHNPDARIVGITGTNGKSTTSALTHFILKDSGMDVQLGGNIGIPYFDLKKADVYIFEMSSYELASSRHLKFEIGCVLNIELDHMDFHGSYENYTFSKHKILDNSVTKIISLEDRLTAETYGHLKDVIKVSTKHEPSADLCILEHAMISGGRSLILDLSDIPNLIGKHNYQNIEFAYAIAHYFGISNALIAKSIRAFQPLPHRMNIVRKVGNVLFVNDSKATNPESASKALSTFIGHKIFWLVGGRSKKADVMKSVGEHLDNVHKIYLFGESSEEFGQIFNGIKQTTDCKTMQNAIREAYKDAMAESVLSVVLLSPMCSSFDQFENFEHRGNEFVQIVEKI